MFRLLTVIAMLLVAACSSSENARETSAAGTYTFAVSCTGDISFTQVPVAAVSSPIGLIGHGQLDCGSRGAKRFDAVLHRNIRPQPLTPCHLLLTLTPKGSQGQGAATATCPDQTVLTGGMSTYTFYDLYSSPPSMVAGEATLAGKEGTGVDFSFTLNPI